MCVRSHTAAVVQGAGLPDDMLAVTVLFDFRVIYGETFTDLAHSGFLRAILSFSTLRDQLAHELGHLLGMRHDEDVACPAGMIMVLAQTAVYIPFDIVCTGGGQQRVQCTAFELVLLFHKRSQRLVWPRFGFGTLPLLPSLGWLPTVITARAVWPTLPHLRNGSASVATALSIRASNAIVESTFATLFRLVRCMLACEQPAMLRD